ANQRVQRVERLHLVELPSFEEALAQGALAQVDERLAQRRAAESAAAVAVLRRGLAHHIVRRHRRRHAMLPTAETSIACSTGASRPAPISNSAASSTSGSGRPLRRATSPRPCSPSLRL